ncbi:unnamed protein product [Rotaria sp. Silwood1]|nr:unnamed protein product [Rotaria sp. Silwood1]
MAASSSQRLKGILSVTVLKANNLIKSDLFGENDCYAIISLEPLTNQSKVKAGKQTQQTETYQKTQIHDGCHPIFNEKLLFPVAQELEALYVQVWDSDIGKDDLLAYGTLNLLDDDQGGQFNTNTNKEWLHTVTIPMINEKRGDGEIFCRLKIFARAKPGATGETVEEEEALEEEQAEEKQKKLYDEHPIDDGWKVSGTIKNSQGYKRPPFVQEIIQYKDRNQLGDYLKEMSVIIYDITQDPEQIDEAVWTCQKLESIINELDHPITFILLSTVMTWAKTQPNEDEVPFSEDEFRRRRAHPNFKEHHSAEKLITKLGLTNKKKLTTYIVATGLTYGMEENVFHYMFKSAWHNASELQVFGKGGNFLPTIHVIDLAAVLQNLADRQLKTRYVVATDTSKDTLIRITRKVSQTLGMEEEDAEDKKPPVNERIIPEHVIILDASNEFLRQRIMHLPEKVVAGTHNTELEFKRRLKIYNELGDDSHPGKFFEDVDRPGETIKIDDDRSINHRNIVEKIMERVKEPHNYGPTPEEQEHTKQRERDEQEAANDRMKKQKEWTAKLEQIKREEFEMLDAQSTPLRNYLMAHVMPTLTKALIECCQVRPEDPVDFVAEYLFKNNPQV